MNHLEFSRQKLSEFINSRQEWLLQSGSGKTFALDKNEIEIEIKLDKLLFGFLDGKGFQMWRVKKYEIEDGKLNLDLTRNFERDSSKITLVARVSAKDLSESVELARLEKAGKIAAIIIENQPKSKLVRVRLNKENGRAANFLFENPNKVQIAAIADVSDSLSPEVLISTAIFQLSRLQNRKKNPIDTLWILSEKNRRKNSNAFTRC
jgi:hypothetical protein